MLITKSNAVDEKVINILRLNLITYKYDIYFQLALYTAHLQLHISK